MMLRINPVSESFEMNWWSQRLFSIQIHDSLIRWSMILTTCRHRSLAKIAFFDLMLYSIFSFLFIAWLSNFCLMIRFSLLLLEQEIKKPCEKFERMRERIERKYILRTCSLVSFFSVCLLFIVTMNRGEKYSDWKIWWFQLVVLSLCMWCAPIYAVSEYRS